MWPRASVYGSFNQTYLCDLLEDSSFPKGVFSRRRYLLDAASAATQVSPPRNLLHQYTQTSARRLVTMAVQVSPVVRSDMLSVSSDMTPRHLVSMATQVTPCEVNANQIISSSLDSILARFSPSALASLTPPTSPFQMTSQVSYPVDISCFLARIQPSALASITPRSPSVRGSMANDAHVGMDSCLARISRSALDSITSGLCTPGSDVSTRAGMSCFLARIQPSALASITPGLPALTYSDVSMPSGMSCFLARIQPSALASVSLRSPHTLGMASGTPYVATIALLMATPRSPTVSASGTTISMPGFIFSPDTDHVAPSAASVAPSSASMVPTARASPCTPWEVRLTVVDHRQMHPVVINAAGERLILGEGAFGMVFVVNHWTPTGRSQYVCKQLKDYSTYNDAVREAQLQSYLQTTGVVPAIVGLAHDGSTPSIYQEYIPDAMTMAAMLALPLLKVGGPKFLRVLRNLALAMHAVHMAHVLHNDMKTDNLIVCPDEKVYIIDFGLATFRCGRVSHAHISARHNHIHMAPELFYGHESTVKSDIYGLGYVMSCVCHRLGGHMTLWTLADQCCDPEPNLRPDLASIVAELETLIIDEGPDLIFEPA